MFFLYGRDPRTGEMVGPLGSGLFVGLHSQFNPAVMVPTYAVTCHHCIRDGGCIIRFNSEAGETILIEVEPHEWEFDAGGSDVAVADITGWIIKNAHRFTTIPDEIFATKEFMEEVEFGLGEDGFMLGLFADQPGKKRNLVAARFGNVSLLASDDDPLEQPNGNYRPSHLFDIRSRPGFSGSPVFAYRTPSSDLRHAALRGKHPPGLPTVGSIPLFSAEEIRQNTFITLLGIHAGQYHDRVKVVKVKGPNPETDTAIKAGDELNVPNSVALIVPAWDILSLLDRPKLAEQRKAREIA